MEYVMCTTCVRKLFGKAAQGSETKKSQDCAGREITVCIFTSVITLSGGCLWTLNTAPALEL